MSRLDAVAVVTAVLLAVLLPAADSYTRPDQGEVLFQRQLTTKKSCLIDIQLSC
jgi:hypothetical protein